MIIFTWPYVDDLAIMCVQSVSRVGVVIMIVMMMMTMKNDDLCKVDRFIKVKFGFFLKLTFLFYILIDKQMLENVFCSNVAPLLGNTYFTRQNTWGIIA